MSKSKVQFLCHSCGSLVAKWQGQCPECFEWNTLTEALDVEVKHLKSKGYSGQNSEIQKLSNITIEDDPRISTGMLEVDRVLGGGVVPGSVILIGGDPGIGKSSLLIQIMTFLSRAHKALYVTGEESVQQVALRSRRMGLYEDKLLLVSETNVGSICHIAKQEKPSVMVIDSIQTMQVDEIPSAAGGVSQVRESAALLTKFAKQNHCAIFLVGHVTKTGEVAGPRVLEHIVDAVIFLEGQNDGRYRIMRALKNRFGAVNEIGIFVMTDKGMQEVKNPSALFLSHGNQDITGNVVSALWKGSRPLLVEIQALADENTFGNPRRVSIGVDGNRLVMLLAAMHRHANIFSADKDIFINVSGGVKVTETSVDLALVVAIISSMNNIVISNDWVIFGEVGLSGEVRPVAYGQERIFEAEKHGFKAAVIPQANKPKKYNGQIKLLCINNLRDVLALIGEQNE
ncbi:MAG: DNA repair protein RadA/Sms [Francisellaceae bacterium]|jgi:DNA repair protein RadA/Sms